jgi:16S rRNA (cytosine1402-N4)-methyltransferase
MQLDMGHKGFSLMRDGPLDMRMGPDAEWTAEEIVNTWSELQLATLFRDYGEEPRWRQAAHAIVEARRKGPIKTTKQLADLITEAFVGRGRLHPATLIFQALRICVNRELEAVEVGLKKAIDCLAPGGVVGVISFHSLEDRIVKHIFKEASTPPTKRERLAGTVFEPILRLLTKKPLVPTFAEMKTNARSRSAKLRFAERL